MPVALTSAAPRALRAGFKAWRKDETMTLSSARFAFLASAAAAVLAASLPVAALAEGFPTPGGTVPSTLSLSLGEPSPFRRVGRTRSGQNVYAATIRAEVNATDAPTRLGLGFEGPPLRLWREPLAAEQAKIHLREIAPNRRALRNRTVVVTLTAGGP